MISTTASATPSNNPSIAPNASMKSPRMPPWPPTNAVSPSGASSTTPRIVSTVAVTSSPSEVVIGATIWAAVPSSEKIGPLMRWSSTFSRPSSSSTYPDRLPVGVGQSGGALEDESGGDALVTGELGELLQGDRRLCRPRQKGCVVVLLDAREPVSYTHLRAHETDSYLVCRLLLEKKK